MENCEIIEVFFNLGIENVDWVKRELRKINDSSTSVSENIVNKILTQSTQKQNISPSVETKKSKKVADETIFRNINNVKRYLKNREKESYGLFNSSEEYLFIGKLDALVDIINENMDFYKSKKEVKELFNQINRIKQRVLRPLETRKVKPESISNTINLPKPKVKGQRKTQMGIEIQNRLNIIKREVRRKDLTEAEINNLTNELSNIFYELNTNLNFTNLDNIPVKLTQVKKYQEKLESLKMNIRSSSVKEPRKTIISDSYPIKSAVKTPLKAAAKSAILIKKSNSPVKNTSIRQSLALDIYCPCCNKLLHKTAYLNHLKEHSANQSYKILSKNLVNVNSILCPICLQSFAKNESFVFIQHVEEKHPAEFESGFNKTDGMIRCKMCDTILQGVHPAIIVQHIICHGNG